MNAETAILHSDLNCFYASAKPSLQYVINVFMADDISDDEDQLPF